MTDPYTALMMASHRARVRRLVEHAVDCPACARALRGSSPETLCEWGRAMRVELADSWAALRHRFARLRRASVRLGGDPAAEPDDQ